MNEFILGIDPGPVNCGYGLLENNKYVDAGVLRNEGDRLIDQLGIIMNQANLIAVEGFRYQGKRVAVNDIIATCQIIGMVKGLACAKGLPVIELMSSEWRSLLFIPKGADDNFIREKAEKLLRYKFNFKNKTEAKNYHHAVEACAIALAAERRGK